MSHTLRMTIEDVDNNFREYLKKYHLSAVVYANDRIIDKLSLNDSISNNVKKPKLLINVKETERIMIIFENSRPNDIQISDVEVECRDIIIMQQLNLESPVQKWFRIQVKSFIKEFYEYFMIHLKFQRVDLNQQDRLKLLSDETPEQMNSQEIQVILHDIMQKIDDAQYYAKNIPSLYSQIKHLREEYNKFVDLGNTFRISNQKVSKKEFLDKKDMILTKLEIFYKSTNEKKDNNRSVSPQKSPSVLQTKAKLKTDRYEAVPDKLFPGMDEEQKSPFNNTIFKQKSLFQQSLSPVKKNKFDLTTRPSFTGLKKSQLEKNSSFTENTGIEQNNLSEEDFRKKNIEIMYLRDNIEELKKEIKNIRLISDYMVQNISAQGKTHSSKMREYVDKKNLKTDDAVYIRKNMIQIFNHKQETLLIETPDEFKDENKSSKNRSNLSSPGLKKNQSIASITSQSPINMGKTQQKTNLNDKSTLEQADKYLQNKNFVENTIAHRHQSSSKSPILRIREKSFIAKKETAVSPLIKNFHYKYYSDIDKALDEYEKTFKFNQKFIKHPKKENTYTIGGKQLFLQLQKGRVLVRVGGGYMDFIQYLEPFIVDVKPDYIDYVRYDNESKYDDEKQKIAYSNKRLDVINLENQRSAQKKSTLIGDPIITDFKENKEKDDDEYAYDKGYLEQQQNSPSKNDIPNKPNKLKDDDVIRKYKI